MVHPFRRRVLKSDETKVPGVNLEPRLNVLADDHGAAASENISARIAFNHYRAGGYRIAVFGQSGIQERLAIRGKLLAGGASLK